MRSQTAEHYIINTIVAFGFLILGSLIPNLQNFADISWTSAVLITAMLVTLGLILTIFLRLRDDIQQSVTEQAVAVEWCDNFDRTAQLVDRAERSIVVATAIGAKRDNILKTESRSTYLDHITQKIREDANIRYLRLMPTHEYEALKDGRLTLAECDSAAAKHLAAVAHALHSPNNGVVPTKVNVKLTPPVALLPSTIVIDETHVCFAFPMKTSRAINGHIETTIRDVIVISDYSGKIPTRVRDIIESVSHQGIDILGELERYIGDVRDDVNSLGQAAHASPVLMRNDR
ncbi:hypothetical protein [Roseomonas sp. AR75]|uniref:hypothetical protein n=1 Tax=Roseomonas sp. AR75 TaxID=2562311 RepID=UPI0010C09D46|nr:hypothetical protein [Roseomonas sp. AR75]